MEQYNLKITLIEPMLGTVPKNKEIYKTYIASKTSEGNLAEEVETVEEIEEKGWTGFHSDENGLFIYDYLFKGFIKEARNTLKNIVKVKALRSKLDSYLFVFPRRIYLGKTEPDNIAVLQQQGSGAVESRVVLQR